MEYTPVKLGGRTLYLYCNAAACFDIYEAFGYDRNIVDLLGAPGRVGYGNVLRIAAILADEGELSRRWEGRSPQEPPSAEDLCRLVTPADYGPLKRACVDAVRRGFSPTVDDAAKPRYRDKSLERFEKSVKKNGVGRSEYLYVMTRRFGLSVRDALRLTFGTAVDFMRTETNAAAEAKEARTHVENHIHTH